MEIYEMPPEALFYRLSLAFALFVAFLARPVGRTRLNHYCRCEDRDRRRGVGAAVICLFMGTNLRVPPSWSGGTGKLPNEPA